MNRFTAIGYLLLLTVCFQTSIAQSWIPSNVQGTTILVERFQFQNPDKTLLDIDEDYEDLKDGFIEKTNANLDSYNQKLDGVFKAYNHNYETTTSGKIDTDYPDKRKYRYVLRREIFFGKKRVFNAASNKLDDESYVAYRYYFYDRLTRREFSPYYFSGDQWRQLRRLVFWLNQPKG